MIALQTLRNALLRGEHYAQDIGLATVSAILELPQNDAEKWINLYGNPRLDPVSAVFLAICASIDGGILLNTSLNREELAVENARPKLAEDVLVLLLTSLIVFRSGNPDEAPVN